MLDKLYITPRQWLHILRWTLYSLLLLLALMVQTVVLGNRTVFGLHPVFVPLVITCVCLREGPERGGTFALLASLFWHLSGADMGSVSILVLTVVPLLGSLLCRKILANRFLPCLLFCLLTLFTDQSLIFLLKYFLDGLPGAYYTEQLLPCVLVSLCAQPLIYLLVKWIARIGDTYEST